LETIRLDRGALTESRLLELCDEAKQVLSDVPSSSVRTESPVVHSVSKTPVKVKIESASDESRVPAPFSGYDVSSMINLSDLSDYDLH